MTSRTLLLTGYPASELARHALPRLLAQAADVELTLLVPEPLFDHASERLALLPQAERERISILLGDVAALDFGLSGREYLELAARVHTIQHFAAVTYSGASRELAERVNVGGTSEVIELARVAPQLQRVVHWSALHASAGRDGIAYEDELTAPPADSLAHTRYRAEKLIAKARAELPITVIRTAMLVGDSQTGELARIEGAHLLIAALLSAPRDLPGWRPAPGHALLQVVPIDYAVAAGLLLAQEDRGSSTYHVLDRAPLTLDELLQQIAQRLGRPVPRSPLPPAFTQAVLRIPGFSKLVHAQRALVDELTREVHYDDRNAHPLLARAGVRCPPLASYLDKLIAHVEREQRLERPLPSYAAGRPR